MYKRILFTLVVAVAGLAALTAMPAAAKVGATTSGRIAFSRYDPTVDDSYTYTANPDGSNPQQLFAGFTSGEARWSPDGTQVAVGSGLGIPCPPTCTGNTVIINPDTGAYRVVTPEGFPAVSEFCTIWSPDASHFVCDGENDNDPRVNGIYTIRSSDRGGLTRITNAAGGTDVPIDYSPHGTQIVFGHFGPFRTCDKTSALYLVNVDGSGLHRITPWGFCDDDGSWSPDGTKIAFASGERLGRIYVVRPDGTGLMQIPIPVSGICGLGDVSWSPGGTKIGFILSTGRGPGTGREGIYTANANGTDLQQVTASPTFDHEVDWGPHPITP